MVEVGLLQKQQQQKTRKEKNTSMLQLSRKKNPIKYYSVIPCQRKWKKLYLFLTNNG